MLIDTHSHLNFNAFKNDAEKVIKRCLAENIWVINIGSRYETSKKAVEIAENYKEGVYAAIGLHPIHSTPDFVKKRIEPEEGGFLASGEEFDKEKYRQLAQSEKVVAIGEIGLDYYYRPKTKRKIEEFKNKQKEVFIKQLELAEELSLPVIFHCRMAHTDLIEILKSQIPNPNAQSNPKSQAQIRGVIHCFTGTLEEAKQYIDMGFYIGLNGIIFKLNLDEVIKKIPLERILIETDCPYLIPPLARRSPAVSGGEGGLKQVERNEPIFVKYVAQKIAELKRVDYSTVAQATFESAKNLFRI